MPKSTSKSFEATLEPDGTALKWVIVRVPFDSARLWGRGHIRVQGEINGFAFSTSLFPTGDGRHTLLVNKSMQRGGKAQLGSVARFRLTPDHTKREVLIPAELAQYFAEDRALGRWFNLFSDSMRRYMCKLISDLKSPAARARRAEQLVEQMLSAMDAERELPPILRIAFARDAKAEQGWGRMSATQRRHHLLGIFHYRSPNARARRIARVMADARKAAERGERPKRELS